jgi:hypothetical protein
MTEEQVDIKALRMLHMLRDDPHREEAMDALVKLSFAAQQAGSQAHFTYNKLWHLCAMAGDLVRTGK